MKMLTTSCQSIAIEQEQLVRAMACIVDGKCATYVSGPITTGRRYIDWYLSYGRKLEFGGDEYNASLKRYVSGPNESDIAEIAKEVRKYKGPVIEPATLYVAGWGQQEYLTFWVQVIEKFASEMVVVRGWQYSLGCAAEFRHAVNTGIAVKDCDGFFIDLNTGFALISEAADEIARRGEGVVFLRELSAKLRRFTV